MTDDLGELIAVGRNASSGIGDANLRTIIGRLTAALEMVGRGHEGHTYPDRHPKGSHWSTDVAWEMLDLIKPGEISDTVRAFIAGWMGGALEKEREAANDLVTRAQDQTARYGDEVERLLGELAKLQDPNAVHINMLRGTIAKPSVEQIRHLYPELEPSTAAMQNLRDLLQMCRDWLFSAYRDENSLTGTNVRAALPLIDAKIQALTLCEDEGCPHYGTPHICINDDKPA